jgi:hypothetical protein
VAVTYTYFGYRTNNGLMYVVDKVLPIATTESKPNTGIRGTDATLTRVPSLLLWLSLLSVLLS